MKLEGLVLRRGPAQQAGIEVLHGFGGSSHALADQAEVDRIVDDQAVRRDGLIACQFVQSVLRRVLGHDGDGQNDGHVVAGFLGQNVALVEFPEIGIAGALDRLLHGAWP